jgi:hypothetical protein
MAGGWRSHFGFATTVANKGFRMTFFSVWTWQPRRRRRATSSRHSKRYRLGLEWLERREVPSTFTVTRLGDTGTGSGLQGDLRYCINHANANADLSNHIQFQPGLSGTIVLMQGSLDITKNLEIDGPGEDVVTVSGNHHSGVFNITADPRAQVVAIAGLTIADGTGVLVGDHDVGGGIYNDHAELTLSHCTITGNSAVATPFGSGGGIDSHGTLILDSCTVSGNSSDNYGGGITASDRGGHGSLTIDSSLIADNLAGPGGTGGGLEIKEPATITDSTISGNTAGDFGFGGGIDVFGSFDPPITLAISRSTIAANTARNGGGLDNSDGLVTLTNTTVSGNAGEGLGNSRRMSVVDSVISDNRGSGITSLGQLTVSGSTISGNATPSSGGGLRVSYGDASVVNSTISGNTAGTAGGGVDAFGNVSVELTSVTITGNTANGVGQTTHGGGGLASRPSSIGRAVLRNTLIAGNDTASLGPDVIGTVTSLGYNLIGQRDDSLGWVARDRTGDFFAPLDPLLGPLQDNGGPTPTFALPANSPAHNAGDPTLQEALDQRGTIRHHAGVNPGVDIGAFDGAFAAAFRLVAPAEVVAGEPFALTVVAVDAAGNLASTYTGTIHFSSTDFAAALPDDYRFAAGDAGVATFPVTLQTPGSQQVQASDVPAFHIAGRATVNVDAPSGTAGRVAPLVDLFFGEADPADLDFPFRTLGGKGHRRVELD